jgi:hypothetical protein
MERLFSLDGMDQSIIKMGSKDITGAIISLLGSTSHDLAEHGVAFPYRYLPILVTPRMLDAISLFPGLGHATMAHATRRMLEVKTLDRSLMMMLGKQVVVTRVIDHVRRRG